MPILVVYDNGFFRRHSFAPRVKNGICLLGDALVKFFAVLVVLVDSLCLFKSLTVVSRHKKLYRLAAALHSARRVYARTNLEYDIRNSYLLARQSAYSYDCLKPHVRARVDAFQSVIRKNTVFINHRNNVCRDTDSHKVKHTFKIALRQRIAHGKRLHELVAHTATAEMAARIGAAFQLRIQYGCRRRQLVIRHMVVTDYEINAQRPGILYFLDCLYAAIKNYYELNPLRSRIVNTVLRYSVALVIAARNIVLDI